MTGWTESSQKELQHFERLAGLQEATTKERSGYPGKSFHARWCLSRCLAPPNTANSWKARSRM
eukprot:6204202-Prorocentrum_lima.AAC.1